MPQFVPRVHNGQLTSSIVVLRREQQALTTSTSNRSRRASPVALCRALKRIALDRLVQGLRRGFAKQRLVRAGKSTELVEAITGRCLRDGRGPGLARADGPTHL